MIQWNSKVRLQWVGYSCTINLRRTLWRGDGRNKNSFFLLFSLRYPSCYTWCFVKPGWLWPSFSFTTPRMLMATLAFQHSCSLVGWGVWTQFISNLVFVFFSPFYFAKKVVCVYVCVCVYVQVLVGGKGGFSLSLLLYLVLKKIIGT